MKSERELIERIEGIRVQIVILESEKKHAETELAMARQDEMIRRKAERGY